jgi:hypothetical protein
MPITLGTFTVDTATDELILNNGLIVGHRVAVSSTDVLPSPMSNAVEYWVIAVTATRFKLSLVEGGSALNITDAGTGTHTAFLTCWGSNTGLGYNGSLTKGTSIAIAGTTIAAPWFLSAVNKGLLTKANAPQGPPWRFRSIDIGREHYVNGARENTDGDPIQPSLRQDKKGRHRLRWSVKAGARFIAVKVKQPTNLSPRPSVIIKANPEIGLPVDLSGTAPSGTDWVTIGPISVTPSARGAVWVELWNNVDGGGGAPCYWDNIVAF